MLLFVFTLAVIMKVKHLYLALSCCLFLYRALSTGTKTSENSQNHGKDNRKYNFWES